MAKSSDAVRVEALVRERAAQHPEKVALIFGTHRWTYARLHDTVEQRAAALVAAGLRAGEVVLTTALPTDDLLIAFLACCRANGIFLSLSPQLTASEVLPLVARAAARFVLTETGARHPFLPDLPSLPLDLPGNTSLRQVIPEEIDIEAIACLQTSSGTTGGVTKLICTPHRMLTWRRTLLAWWESAANITYSPQATYFFVRGFCDVLGQGGTIVISHATNPAQIEREMAAENVTVLRTIPALLGLLVTQPQPPPSMLALRIVRTGAAALPSSMMGAAIERYHALVVQEYASTEGGSMITTARSGTPEGSLGQSFPGVSVRIVDGSGADVTDGEPGELWVRSQGLMRGYLGDPAATARAFADGWLRTGDLAVRDSAGNYSLVGRQSLRINVNGFMVSPDEVEAVIRQHPGVQDVVVLGMPDRRRGEAVRAVIVPSGAPPSVSELRRFCRERLAPYKVPRRVEFRDALPRSPLGKMLRHLL